MFSLPQQLPINTLVYLRQSILSQRHGELCVVIVSEKEKTQYKATHSSLLNFIAMILDISAGLPGYEKFESKRWTKTL